MCKLCNKVKKDFSDYIFCPYCGSQLDSLFSYNKSSDFLDIVNQYTTDEEVIKQFNYFIEMRKSKKKFPTTHAVIMILDKIYKKWQSSDEQAAEIFKNSVMNSWTNVYELKDKVKKPSQENIITNDTDYEDIYEIYFMR